MALTIHSRAEEDGRGQEIQLDVARTAYVGLVLGHDGRVGLRTELQLLDLVGGHGVEPTNGNVFVAGAPRYLGRTRRRRRAVSLGRHREQDDACLLACQLATCA